MFAINFLKCNILLIFIILVVRILTLIFKNFFSTRSYYTIGLILLLALLIPFFPISRSSTNNTEFNFQTSAEESVQDENRNAFNTDSGLFTDTTEDISKLNWNLINSVLLLTWLTGVFFTFIKVIYINYKIYLLKKYALSCQNVLVTQLFNHCLDDMGITKNISLKITSEISTPCIVGLFNICILFPKQTLADIPPNDLRYICLHELQHYKQKDILINYLICIIRILYWFNPIVHWLLKDIRQVQELSCDSSVLNRINSNDYYNYGNALINFAELISKQEFPALYNIGGSYESIKRRIVAIANYKKHSLKHKIKESILIICTATIIFCNIPSLYLSAAKQNTVSLEELNYTTTDLSSYFETYNGSFVLYDTQKNMYSMYNIDRCITQSSPDSTYKIYSALSALESSVITPTNNFQSWSGEKYPIETWNHNHNLESAMSDSVNWYFQNLDLQTGRDELQTFLNKISYGNRDITGGLSGYWLESSLLVSPLEQVQLLTNFYKNTWNFKAENIETVKKSILISDSQYGTLYGKTGTGKVNGNYVNGWFVGFIETNENTFIFATNIQGSARCDGSTAASISLNILSDLGVY